MARTPDTPAVARRREREQRTISQMVALYCAGNHPDERTERAHCGEPVCPDCKAIDDYCVKRTERCRSMEHKTNCEECGNHCYAPAQRDRIRAIMRHAGPRMMLHHPVAALRHMLKR